MLRINRRTAGLLVVGALATSALVAPGVSQAKTVKMKYKSLPNQPIAGTKLKATYKGTPFGTCKMTGVLVLPVTKTVWKCKGGSFKVVNTGKSGAANDAFGTLKISGGKGKFKGIKGKGTFKGKLSDGIFTVTATVKL